MEHKLTTAVIGLLNSYTNLMSDLAFSGIPEVSNRHVNDIKVSPSFRPDGWELKLSAYEYDVTFSPDNMGHLTHFDKTLEEASIPLSEFMDEDTSENFLAEIASIPGRIKEIDQAYNEIKDDEKEMHTQSVAAMVISQWFNILRWFEDAEIIGIDETVQYVPSYKVGEIDGIKTVVFENNALSLSLSKDDKPPMIDGTTLSVQSYSDIAFKNDPNATNEYYIKQNLESFKVLTFMLFAGI